MPQANPYSNYQVTDVKTADQRTLIIMLYDGFLRFMKKGVARMEAGDVEGAHNYLVRSREIVAELMATLKPEKGGEVGMNLKRLYVYVFERVVQANMTKDIAQAQEAIQLMSTLREGWAMAKAGQTPAESGLDKRQISITG